MVRQHPQACFAASVALRSLVADPVSDSMLEDVDACTYYLHPRLADEQLW
jgi:hypothetical protein